MEKAQRVKGSSPPSYQRVGISVFIERLERGQRPNVQKNRQP